MVYQRIKINILQYNLLQTAIKFKNLIDQVKTLYKKNLNTRAVTCQIWWIIREILLNRRPFSHLTESHNNKPPNGKTMIYKLLVFLKVLLKVTFLRKILNYNRGRLRDLLVHSKVRLLILNRVPLFPNPIYAT